MRGGQIRTHLAALRLRIFVLVLRFLHGYKPLHVGFNFSLLFGLLYSFSLGASLLVDDLDRVFLGAKAQHRLTLSHVSNDSLV